jgi:hypothetical protein
MNDISAQRLEVDVFGQDEAIELLLLRTDLSKSPSEDVTAECDKIVNELGFLAIGIEQAAAYIRVELDQDIFKFLEIYERRRNEILQKRPTNWEYPASVATTWSLSFECIRDSNPNAALCLNLFAFLNPDGIIPSFLEDAAVLLEDNIGPLQLFKSIMTDSFLFSQALAELGPYSLISRHREASIITIHRLVQAVLQDNMDLKEQTTFRKIVVDLIWAALPESEDEYHSKAVR